MGNLWGLPGFFWGGDTETHTHTHTKPIPSLGLAMRQGRVKILFEE